MYVVDASVWVARFVSTDAFHAPSRIWFRSLNESDMLIVGPTLLLPELASAVSRRTGRPELAAAALSRLERIRRLRLVSLDPQLARLAGNLAGQLRLSGADAVYASLAQILRLPLVTWDDEQRRRAAATVQAVTPAQLLAGPIP